MKNYITKQDGYTRYKIANNFKYHPKKGRFPCGKAFYIIEPDDDSTKLRPFFMSYEWTGDKKKKFTNTYKNFVLSFKKGKLNLYRYFPGQGVRNISNKASQLVYNDCKTQRVRANTVLQRFLRRNGIKYKLDKEQAFRDNVALSCYPMLRLLDNTQYSLPISSNYSRYLRCESFKEVIHKCFGQSNRHLLKIVAENVQASKSFNCLDFGIVLKKIVPIDILYTILCSHYCRPYNHFDIPNTRRFLKKLNNSQLSKIMKNVEFHAISHRYLDVVKMSQEYDIDIDFKFKTVNDLHNILIKKTRQMKTPDFDLPISKGLQKIDNANIGDLKVVLPKTNYQLIDWADQMHNCVHSYVNSIKTQRCNILGIEKDNKLIYNLEIVGRRLGQFYGPCNSLPEIADRNAIANYLAVQGIIQPELKNNCWEEQRVDDDIF